jgi:hypothetical protein
MKPIVFTPASTRQWVKLSVGDWRVIFYEENDSNIIAAVGHRREIYD